MALLAAEEREKRIAEVHTKGVYFHTFSARTKPLSAKEADNLIERNMDALIGNKKVKNSHETIARLKEIFGK